MKRFLIILSVVAVLLATIATVVIVLRSRSSSQVPAAADSGVRRPEAGTNTPPVSGAAETPAPNGIVPREKDAPPELSETDRKDADNDGLIDGEEALLRTDPNRKDTDGDGLGDADEARTYCTNPLKAMTDGKTSDAAWVEQRRNEARSAGQRPIFCVE